MSLTLTYGDGHSVPVILKDGEGIVSDFCQDPAHTVPTIAPVTDAERAELANLRAAQKAN
jgi:hypothetical protein